MSLKRLGRTGIQNHGKYLSKLRFAAVILAESLQDLKEIRKSLDVPWKFKWDWKIRRVSLSPMNVNSAIIGVVQEYIYLNQIV